MKVMKQAFNEPSASFINPYEMTTSVRFCLSYDPLKWVSIGFEVNIISIRKCIVDMDVVNDFRGMCQSVFTHVVIGFLAHLSHRLRVSYCHWPMSVVHRLSCVVNNCFKRHLL